MKSFATIVICMIIFAVFGSNLVVSGDPGAPSYAKGLSGLIGAIKWGGIGFFVGFIFVVIPRSSATRFLAGILALSVISLLGWSDIKRSYDSSRKVTLADQISKGTVKLDTLVEDWKIDKLPEWKLGGFYAGLMYGKSISNDNLKQLWLLCNKEDPKNRWIIERIIFYKNTPPELINQIYTEYSKRPDTPVPNELLLAFAKSEKTPSQILLKLKNNPNVYVSSFAKENLEKRQSNTPLEPSR